jgi:hypothetical protein
MRDYPLMAVPAGGCLWPKDVLSPEPATSFCCAPVAPGRSYCPTHLRLAYRTSAASTLELARAAQFVPEVEVIEVDRIVERDRAPAERVNAAA